ncbi:MAG: MmgE/PrpD family protein [Pseudomonadota bacterium]
MNHTRALADFCSNLTIDDLPEEVVGKAKLCILDYVANIYGSLELNAVANVIAYIKSIQQKGNITALGCGFKTNIHLAAFINGTTAEAIEAQDGVRFGGNHPCAAVIPAAIAVAEERGLDGRKLIEAVVAGYEAANRPAAAMHPWHTLSGFLPTGTCGTFGAAAASAKLYGFDNDQMLNAIANAGYLLPISMAEHLMGGHTIKIVQGGQAASAGIMAAGLAGAGLTGTPFVLEGSALNGGFTQITTRAAPKLNLISDDLGKTFSIMDVYFKPYTSCRHTHGAAQAVLEMSEGSDIQPADIEKVEVHTYGIAELAVGKGVSISDSFVSAQFSIPYVVAACLLDGELGPKQLTEKRMADPQVIGLSKKVSVKTDETLNQQYPGKTASRVVIQLANGETISRQIDIPKGDPRDPMTVMDIAGKVKKFAGSRSDRKIDDLIQAILGLETVTDIRQITNMM